MRKYVQRDANDWKIKCARDRQGPQKQSGNPKLTWYKCKIAQRILKKLSFILAHKSEARWALYPLEIWLTEEIIFKAPY